MVRWLGVLALGVVFLAGIVAMAGTTPAPLRALAAATLAQVRAAISGSRVDCKLDVLDDRAPPEADCGRGTVSAGAAWDMELSKAGLPSDRREELAGRLDISSSSTLGFFVADKQAVEHLLAELEARAKQDP